MTIPSEFFSCDWGTSSFRLRRVRTADASVLQEIRKPAGIRDLLSDLAQPTPAERESRFAAFLADRLLECLGTSPEPGELLPPVMLSGMASSSVGWRELPYAPVPFRLDGSSVRRATLPLTLGAHRETTVHILSGVATASEILRGEETELLGLFSDGAYLETAEDGLVLLPGTHSKLVRLRQRELVEFRTFMTGELYDVLSRHSLLRASVQTPEGMELDLMQPAAKAAFLEGVDRVARDGLAGSLFQVRTRAVLRGAAPALNRCFLSGLLIGAEIADVAASARDTRLLLAAPPATSLAYRLACDRHALAKPIEVVPPEALAAASISGHSLILRALSAAPTPSSTP